MPKRCIPCLGSAIKEVLIEELAGQISHLGLLLEDVPDCDNALGIDLCTKGRKPRGRSQYQEYISVCMKAKNIKGFGNAAPAMKECAAEWKAQKA